jgi:aconitate hydratase
VAGTLAEKLIESHLVGGVAVPGEEIALRVDHTLSQDATGTLVMQGLEDQCLAVPPPNPRAT